MGAIPHSVDPATISQDMQFTITQAFKHCIKLAKLRFRVQSLDREAER
jgi:hypothetical protein